MPFPDLATGTAGAAAAGAIDVGFPHLEGSLNFSTWLRDFQGTARSRGVWTLINGTEELDEKPTQEGTTEKAEAHYRFLLVDWKEQQERNRTALTLLLYAVTPSIRRRLYDYVQVHDAFAYLSTQYRLSNYRACQEALSRMDSIKITFNKSMSDFLDEIFQCQLDIKEAKGEYDDALILNKLARTLPREYDEFVQTNITLVNAQPLLDDITAKLLAIEPKMLERAKKAKRDTDNKKDAQNTPTTTKEGGKKSSRPKCTGCNRYGHVYEDCRTTNSEVKAKLETAKEKDNDKDKNGDHGKYVKPNVKGAATTALADAEPVRRRFAALALAGNRFAAFAEDEPIDAACPPSEGGQGTSPTRLAPPTDTDSTPQACQSSSQENNAEPGVGGGAGGRWTVAILERTLGVATSGTASAFLAADAHSIHRTAVLLDSGSNVHIVNDSKFFIEMHPHALSIGTASGGASMGVTGEGTVVLPIPTDSGEIIELELREVMFVPDARCNLISLDALAQANFGGSWGSDFLTIEKEGETLWQVKATNGLFILPSAQGYPKVSSDIKIAGNVDFTHPVWAWHARLGHPTVENMRKLLKNSTGMNLTDAQLKAKVKAICPTCAITKATVRVPRDPAGRDFEEPGDLLHVDTWGPYHKEAYDGTKFFLFVTDHATRYTWAVACPNKENMAERVVLLHRRIEKTFQLTIRSYRLDGEFYGTNVLKDFCTRKGVTLEPTIPYAHYMNGVAERGMRTIREKASANLIHSRLPETITEILTSRSKEFLRECSEVPSKFWPEAVHHAVHLKNRTPTRVRKSGKTPWELLRGTLPNLSIERTWGSRTYVTIPHELQGAKIHEPRAWMGYVVGCIQEAGYRVYDPRRDRVFRVSMPRVDQRRDPDDRVPDSQEVATEPPASREASADEDPALPSSPTPSSSTHPLQQFGSRRLRSSISSAVSDNGPVMEHPQVGENDGDPFAMNDDGQNQSPTPLAPEEGWMADYQDVLAENDFSDYGFYCGDRDRALNDHPSYSHAVGNTTERLSKGPFAMMARAHKRKRMDDDIVDADSEAESSDSEVIVNPPEAKAARQKDREITKQQSEARKAWLEKQARPTYRQCKKCGTWTSTAMLVDTHLGEYCRLCGKAIPDPDECALCPNTTSARWHNTPNGRICGGCYQRTHKAGGKNVCDKCSRSVIKVIETVQGTVCVTCANKIPNPDKCPVCGSKNKGRAWHHRPDGKICHSCKNALTEHGKADKRQTKGSDCNYCFNNKLICDRTRQCSNCTAAKIKCHNSSVQKNIPKVDQCEPCIKRHTMCDGKRPCQACIDRHTPYRCVAPGTPTPRKCTLCQRKSLYCDENRPCHGCMTESTSYRGDYRCYDIDIDNLVVYGHTTKDKERQEWLTRDSSTCLTCQTSNRRCSGQPEDLQPCFECVTAKDNVSFCSWTTIDGMMIKIPTLLWTFTYDEGSDTPKLTRDLEYPSDFMAKDLQKGGALSRRVRRAGWYQNRKQRLSRAKLIELANDSSSEEDELIQVESFQSLTGLQLDTSAASVSFKELYPEGYVLIPTSGAGLHCALHAITLSLQAQRDAGSLAPVPTYDELVEVTTSDEWLARMLEVDDPTVLNDRNFHVDQAALAATMWAEREHGFPLRMGWITPGGTPRLVSYAPLHGLTTQREPEIFFIHNDNAAAAFPDDPSVLNHFEGIKSPKHQLLKAVSDVHPDVGQDGHRGNSDDDGQSDFDDDLDPDVRRKLQSPNLDSTDKSRARIRSFAHDFAGLSLVGNNTPPEPTSYSAAIKGPNRTEWELAMNVEYKSLIDKNVWECVPQPMDQKPLTTKWVYKYKIGADGTIVKYKARMVARGFQQVEGVDYYETYAPVAKHPTYRILFTISTLLGWSTHQVDVVTAFLNSPLRETVYIRAPPGYPEKKGFVLRLRKALYGLKQASKAWYDTLVAALKHFGWRVSHYDPCLFICQAKKMFIVVWVDDMLIFGQDEKDVQACKEELTSRFAMKDEGPCSYYLGMQVSTKSSRVTITQSTFVRLALTKYDLRDLPPAASPGDSNKRLARSRPNNDLTVPIARRSRSGDTEFLQRYQSMVGTLNWLSTISRPDISFDTGLVARYNADPCQEHMEAVIRIFAYLKGSMHYGICITNKQTGLVGYVDSDYANCEDTRRSTTGFIFLLNGTPISWKSARQKLVTGSTCEAEYVAAYEASKEAIWLKWLLLDINSTGDGTAPIPLYVDNKAARDLAENPTQHERTKHIDIKFHFIRERVQMG